MPPERCNFAQEAAARVAAARRALQRRPPWAHQRKQQQGQVQQETQHGRDLLMSQQAGWPMGQVKHGLLPTSLLLYVCSLAAAGSRQEGTAAAGSGCELPACEVCGVTRGQEGVKLRVCNGCDRVRYCSPECQMQHWKQGGHRQECKRMQAAAAASAGQGHGHGSCGRQ